MAVLWCASSVSIAVSNSPDYLKRVSQVLLAHSDSGTLANVHEEWYFTGECVDYGLPTETCEICSHAGLRYHFTIKNVDTEKELMVGSECIRKFNIAVFDEYGRMLLDETAHDYLESKRKKAKVTLLLQKLCDQEKNSYTDTARSYFRDKGCLTPKLGNLVLWRLAEYNIQHNAADFIVEVENEKQLQDLLDLEDFQKDRIRPALSEDAKYFLETEDRPWEHENY